ncbi:MAG: MFS transporter [Oscillospiraceae bacterium]|jgi:Na+/melibiose symporter-like transporter|nr:MFS transporter [Oscillospiraceae bacterium]
MAKKAAAAQAEAPPKGRRYVGTKETVGFILFDAAASINISDGTEEFTSRILNISKLLQGAVAPITAAWDIVNDLFLAAWIDKTRTRFGKFRPSLVLYPLYGVPMSILFYCLPYIFSGHAGDPNFLPKLILWTIVNMFNEMTGTIGQISRMGMIANITPDANERIGLINKAQFFSMFGEMLPQQIFTILRDVIANSKSLGAKAINQRMQRLFLMFGVGTICLSGAFSLYFSVIARERVIGAEQTAEKPPRIRDSWRAILRNRPLLLLLLTELLEKFSLPNQLKLYTNSILNFRNFSTVTGLPGAPVSYLSFGYVPWLRRRFSTKTLWIVSGAIPMPFDILIFFFGLIRGSGGKRLFGRLVPMMIPYTIKTTAHMALFGAHRVIPEEIRNECIDYGEWKNGFRSEGMIGMLRGLPAKLVGSLTTAFTGVLLDRIGFRTGANYNMQNERTALGVFAMATILPAVTGILGVLPKFFYNINTETRTQMYAELAERRALLAEKFAAAQTVRED